MADQDTEETGKSHTESDEEHRQQIGIVDTVLLAETGVYRASGSNHAGNWMTNGYADPKTKRDRQSKD